MALKTKKTPKTPKIKACIAALTTTFHNDIITERHYIVNGFPECVGFWNLTNKLNYITEDQLISLIRLNIDVVMAVKCNGCCTITVVTNSQEPWERARPGRVKRSVKSPSCDGKCKIHIKRIL